jgi:hypothetical protein
MADSTVVNADQIMITSAGIFDVVTVEQHYGKLCFVERSRDATVDNLFVRNHFERRKEHTANSIANEALAQFPRNNTLIDVGIVGIASGLSRAPKQGMAVLLRNSRHFSADWFKNFRGSKTRNEQSEKLPPGIGERHVRSGTSPPVNHAPTFELLEGPRDRWPGNTELLNQTGFRRNAVARLIIARLNAISHDLKDVPMFGSCRRN